MTVRRWTAAALWLPGLLVATGAAVATAHGLFEVAAAAGVPTPIAAVYPVITDGLALVAYATTARLRPGRGRGYAWTVVVLAAGLSGLAQAAHLAGGVHTAPAWLRFGVGAWPAVAAAIVAHLLYLLGTHTRPDDEATLATAHSEDLSQNPTPAATGASVPAHAPADPATAVQSSAPTPVQPAIHSDTQRAVRPSTVPMSEPARRAPYNSAPPPSEHPTPTAAPARERAQDSARAHRQRHGRLPTVSELMALADVARGTAGTALKQLRAERPALQIVNADRDPETRR